MMTHGIRVLLTRNAGDFSIFDAIDIVDVTDAAIGE